MEVVWIIKAEYISAYKIRLTFNDGINGIVDFVDKFDLPIYKQLVNKEYFKTFKLNSWTIAWENGADFAPEFLYELIIKQQNAQTKTKEVFV